MKELRDEFKTEATRELSSARTLFEMFEGARGNANRGEKTTFVGTYEDLYKRRCDDLFRLCWIYLKTGRVTRCQEVERLLRRLIESETKKASNAPVDGFFAKLAEIDGIVGILAELMEVPK